MPDMVPDLPEDLPVRLDLAKARRLRLEELKLEEELKALQASNTPWAMLGKNVWPLVSGALTIAVSVAVGLVSWYAQTFAARQERDKIFFAAVQMATDPKNIDGRIAGVWSLSQFWHDPHYTQTVANTLGAALVTNPETTDAAAEYRVDAVREAAAQVIGAAIDDKNSREENERLAKLLYGDARIGARGAIAFFKDSMGIVNSEDSQAVLADLRAKRRALTEAIRNNWEYLENGNFTGFELRSMRLYDADARGAAFINADLTGANLCGTQLQGANFSGARLQATNLSGADLAGSTGWENAHIDGVDIHNAKNVPPVLTQAIARHKAFDATFDQWATKWITSDTLVTSEIFTSCNKYD